MNTLQLKWDKLADVKRELAARDWFPGTSGNLSIKVNEQSFLVTASGKDKRKETQEDFLLVDANGQGVEGFSGRPSAETLLHVEVYRKTEAGCSLHVHTVDNNVVSEVYGEAGQVTFTEQEIIKAFGIWEEGASVTIPIIPNHADIPKLASEFGTHVNESAGAVLIRNHGITVWGRDAFEAKKFLEACEFLFSWHIKVLMLKGR